MLNAIISGVVAGVAYSVSNWYNKKKKGQELKGLKKYPVEFDKVKFLKTIGVGVIVGGIAGYLGLSIDMAFGNEMFLFGAVAVVDEGYKLVVHFLKARGAI